MPMMRSRRPQVRPRPPSEARVHAALHGHQAPRPQTVRRYRPVRTARPIPLAIRLAFVCIGLALAGMMLLVGAGIASQGAAQLGDALGDAMSRVGHQSAQPVQASGATETDDRPVFDQPPNGGYTNQATIALSGSIPGTIAGQPNWVVRIYTVDATGKRLRYADVQVSETVKFGVANVKLSQGKNTFTATLVGPHGEGGESKPVVYTLDTTPPKITISSPTANAQIQTATVDVKGKTEAGASVSVRSSRGSGSSTVTADDSGAFKATVPLVAGDNTLTITATDRAGNVGTATVTVKRSLGKLAASLSVNPNKFAAQTAKAITLTVRATASDGTPLANATVVLTVNVPGLGPIQSPELTLSAIGQASWTTTIQNATPGAGFATAVITTDSDGTVTATASITVTAH